jgi:hypothetical protein
MYVRYWLYAVYARPLGNRRVKIHMYKTYSQISFTLASQRGKMRVNILVYAVYVYIKPARGYMLRPFLNKFY